MKSSPSKAPVLTADKKARAKANILKSMLTSFKIEGVSFSPRQIESIRSRAQLAK